MKKSLFPRAIIVVFTLLCLASVAAVGRTSATVAEDMADRTASALAVLIAGEAASSVTITRLAPRP